MNDCVLKGVDKIGVFAEFEVSFIVVPQQNKDLNN